MNRLKRLADRVLRPKVPLIPAGQNPELLEKRKKDWAGVMERRKALGEPAPSPLIASARKPKRTVGIATAFFPKSMRVRRLMPDGSMDDYQSPQERPAARLAPAGQAPLLGATTKAATGPLPQGATPGTSQGAVTRAPLITHGDRVKRNMARFGQLQVGPADGYSDQEARTVNLEGLARKRGMTRDTGKREAIDTRMAGLMMPTDREKASETKAKQTEPEPVPPEPVVDEKTGMVLANNKWQFPPLGPRSSSASGQPAVKQSKGMAAFQREKRLKWLEQILPIRNLSREEQDAILAAQDSGRSIGEVIDELGLEYYTEDNQPLQDMIGKLKTEAGWSWDKATNRWVDGEGKPADITEALKNIYEPDDVRGDVPTNATPSNNAPLIPARSGLQKTAAAPLVPPSSEAELVDAYLEKYAAEVKAGKRKAMPTREEIAAAIRKQAEGK